MKLKNESDILITEIREFFFVELAQIVVVYEYLTGICLLKCPHNHQQSSLSGTAGTYNRHYLTFIHLQINPLQHLKIAKTLVYLLNLYHSIYYFLNFRKLYDCD